MKQLRVLFDYSVFGKYRGYGKVRMHTTYRVVIDSDGHFRLDKKGITANSWRPACWGGDYDRRYSHAEWACRDPYNKSSRGH